MLFNTLQTLLLQVLLTVHSTKPSAKEAREEAATVAASVLSAVGSVNGVSSSDVTTLDVSVHPQINWGEGGQQTIVGYQFNQRLQVSRKVWLTRQPAVMPAGWHLVPQPVLGQDWA